MFVRALAIVVPLLSVCAIANRASAYEERLELSFGIGPSIAVLDDVAPGGSFDVVVSRGISDTWSIGGSLRYSLYHSDTVDHRTSASIEATWALDIVRWVPRLTLGTGPVIAIAGSEIRVGLEGHLRVGADRITDYGFFGFDLGVDGYGFLTDVAPGRLSIGVGARVGWLFERF